MGWKLVPEEPTEEMCRAAENCKYGSSLTPFLDGEYTPENVEGLYKVMLAAAPTLPKLDDYEILNIALACGFQLKEQPDKSLSLHPYVWQFAKAIEERAAQEPVTVIDGFLKQDPSSIPTTDEHNAMLLEQIEELRESLHSIAERSNKLFSANAELVKATEAFLEYMDTNEPVFPEQFETVITNLRAAMDKVKP